MSVGPQSTNDVLFSPVESWIDHYVARDSASGGSQSLLPYATGLEREIQTG
jgi:hypothetical protein